MELTSGTTYKTPFANCIVAAYVGKDQWIIGKDQWIIFSVDRAAIIGMSVPRVFHDKIGKFVFTEQELKDEFRSDEWVRLNGRLRIERIDDEICTEWPREPLSRI